MTSISLESYLRTRQAAEAATKHRNDSNRPELVDLTEFYRKRTPQAEDGAKREASRQAEMAQLESASVEELRAEIENHRFTANALGEGSPVGGWARNRITLLESVIRSRNSTPDASVAGIPVAFSQAPRSLDGVAEYQEADERNRDCEGHGMLEELISRQPGL